MRLAALLASLVLAFALAILTTQSPSPRPLDAPATDFSAHRAMVDIREIAKAPHPLGSEEHVRVRNYLKQRLATLGFQVSEQSGPLTLRAVQRLQRAGGTPEAADFEATNIVAVRSGMDPNHPPLMLMAHYDTVVGSPGAADDSTGVAAILETVRALDARDALRRDLVVVFTDAEEIGLEGARVFFEEHPLAKEVGFIINLEARGGGGRAAMFETGRGDGPTIRAFAPVAMKADGGVTATSLAVFMYEQMPNGTDFTHARERDMAGLNFAFIGRAAQYHAHDSTPDNLDLGAVQHIGSQTLEMADRLMHLQELPQGGINRVYADVFGRVIVSHPLWGGWVILGISLLAIAGTVWIASSRAGLRPLHIFQGVLDGVWFLTAGFVLLQTLARLAGPAGDRLSSSEAYYTQLRRLPWMEGGAAMAVVALALLLMSGVRLRRRRIFGYTLAAMGCMLAFTQEQTLMFLIPAAIAAVLSLWPGAMARTVWGSWTGLLALVFVAGCAAQTAVPEAALIFTWPLLLGSLVALVTALLSPQLTDLRAVAAPALGTVIGGAWLMAMGHFVFLGIGITLAGVLALIGLLVLLTLRPLVTAHSDHVLTGAALVLLLAAGATMGASRLIEPAPVVQENLP
ncbi:M20/M25/M40 family metallo-hydrolase [Brevundimonas sp.]|uniref:M20/M25/M40 family metallo-hydrolase n=1 Tax=Brevundimonas sp. TaxID=1871086 RepID=UPI002898B6AC|nr:M20/M25/M40 family metallo-hydrolase [Brevundimonas sp.]